MVKYTTLISTSLLSLMLGGASVASEKTMDQLQRENIKLRQVATQFRDALKNTDILLKQRTGELQEAITARVRELQSHQALALQAQQLEQENHSLIIQSQQQQSDIQGHLRAIADLTQRLSVQNETEGQLQSRLRVLESQLASKEQDLLQQKTIFEYNEATWTKHYNDLQSLLAAKDKELEQANLMANYNTDNFRKHLSGLEASLSAKDEELEKLRVIAAEVDELKRKNASLRSNNSRMKIMLDEQAQTIEQLSKQLEDLRQQSKHQEETVNELLGKMENLLTAEVKRQETLGSMLNSTRTRPVAWNDVLKNGCVSVSAASFKLAEVLSLAVVKTENSHKEVVTKSKKPFGGQKVLFGDLSNKQ